MNPTRLASLALASLLPASIAAAQPGAGPAIAVEAPPAPTGASEDPNIDRGFLLPTAETQPAGSLTFNDYELFFAGLTYGVTDSVQVSVSALLPVFPDSPIIATGSGKARLVSSGGFKLAVHGSFTIATESGDDATLMTGGSTASFCLDATCHSMLSGTLGGASAGDGGYSDHAVFYGASLVQRIAPRAKLLVEVAGLRAKGDEDGSDSLHVVSYGVRFFGDNIAADVGFVKPVGIDGDDDVFVTGLPFINFSYRTL
jgi:hypothetical protein